MSSGLIQLRIVGAPRLEQMIQNLSKALDTRAILDEGAAVIFNRMRSRFLKEVDPDGVPWVRSKAAIHREATNRGGGTLFDTGKLWRSLQLYAESDTTRAIGTNVTSAKGFPYGVVHQWGSKVLPRRQFLGFGADDVQTMSDVAIHRIIEGLNAA